MVPPDFERPSGARFSPHPFSSSVPDVNSRSARVLFLLVVPGHLVFLYTISCMQGGHTTLTLIFIVFYMTAALLQVPTGRGPGTGLPCKGGRGGGGLAHQTLCTSFSGTGQQIDTGQGLRRTGCSSSGVTDMLCDFGPMIE